MPAVATAPGPLEPVPRPRGPAAPARRRPPFGRSGGGAGGARAASPFPPGAAYCSPAPPSRMGRRRRRARGESGQSGGAAKGRRQPATSPLAADRQAAKNASRRVARYRISDAGPCAWPAAARLRGDVRGRPEGRARKVMRPPPPRPSCARRGTARPGCRRTCPRSART